MSSPCIEQMIELQAEQSIVSANLAQAKAKAQLEIAKAKAEIRSAELKKQIAHLSSPNSKKVKPSTPISTDSSSDSDDSDQSPGCSRKYQGRSPSTVDNCLILQQRTSRKRPRKCGAAPRTAPNFLYPLSEARRIQVEDEDSGMKWTRSGSRLILESGTPTPMKRLQGFLKGKKCSMFFYESEDEPGDKFLVVTLTKRKNIRLERVKSLTMDKNRLFFMIDGEDDGYYIKSATGNGYVTTKQKNVVCTIDEKAESNPWRYKVMD